MWGLFHSVSISHVQANTSHFCEDLHENTNMDRVSQEINTGLALLALLLNVVAVHHAISAGRQNAVPTVMMMEMANNRRQVLRCFLSNMVMFF